MLDVPEPFDLACCHDPIDDMQNLGIRVFFDCSICGRMIDVFVNKDTRLSYVVSVFPVALSGLPQ